MFRNLMLLSMIVFAACRPVNALTPFAATVPASAGAQPTSVSEIMTAVPTANPKASRTPTQPPTATLTPTPSPTVTPTSTVTPTPTITLTPSVTSTSVPISSATPTNPADDPNNTSVPTWTPPPPDPATQLDDHYHFRRPIADGAANWVARTYPYGGTAGGSLQVHHGVDMENPRGTPVLAAADGVVLYAGTDSTTMLGPRYSYYGNVIVIQHPFTDASGQPVFSLYGHLQRIDVTPGQTVELGDQIAVVGDSGVAFGPHLHFEVRVGDAYSFDATRNPELWIFPYQTYGTLASRITDSNGTLLYNAPLQVKSTKITRYAFSYADDSVNPDPVFGENVVLGDLPADYYDVTVSENGRVRFQKIVYIYPNRTTWVDIQLRP